MYELGLGSIFVMPGKFIQGHLFVAASSLKHTKNDDYDEEETEDEVLFGAENGEMVQKWSLDSKT